MIDIRRLKSISNARQFAPGDVIVEDGSYGNEMFIILKGQVGVYKNYHLSNELRLTTLTPGAFFGEMSLFSKQQRSATIVADEPVIALVINSGNAVRFFARERFATKSLFSTLMERIRQGTQRAVELSGGRESEAFKNTYFENTTNIYYFSINHPSEDYIKNVGVDDTVILLGQKVSGIYIVLRGRLGIFKDYKTPNETKIAEIKRGNFLTDSNFPGGISEVSVVALEKTQLLILKSTDIAHFFECEPRALVLIQMLCDRVMRVNQVQETLHTMALEYGIPKNEEAELSKAMSQSGAGLAGNNENLTDNAGLGKNTGNIAQNAGNSAGKASQQQPKISQPHAHMYTAKNTQE